MKYKCVCRHSWSIEITQQELKEHGNPLCPDCDRPMEDEKVDYICSECFADLSNGGGHEEDCITQ